MTDFFANRKGLYGEHMKKRQIQTEDSPLSPLTGVCTAVRKLRYALGDTQQEFAIRTGLAISTVVRYELTRPPRARALAKLEQVATDTGLEDFARFFRAAIRSELYPNYPTRKRKNEPNR